MCGYDAKNAAQGPQLQNFVGRNRDPLMARYLSFKDDVTSYLMDKFITPFAAKSCCQLFSTQIARNFHPIVRTSFRTR